MVIPCWVKAKSSVFVQAEKLQICPIVFIGNFRNKKISKNEFLAQKGISIPLVNYGVSVSFPIESYTLIITRENELVMLKEFKGNILKREMMRNIRKLLKGGERLFFTKKESNLHFTKGK